MTAATTQIFETLETRQLRSGGITLDDGVLTVAGLSTAPNTATVRVEHGTVHAVLNGQEETFSLAGVNSIRVTGGEAADVLAADPSVDVPVRMIGRGGDDSLVGGSGDDVFDGGAGNDTVRGMAGDDRILRVESGDDVRGGDGQDSMTAVASLGNLPGALRSAKVVSLSLIDTDTGLAVKGYEKLADAVTLDLSKLPKHLSVMANLAGGTSDVRFDLDGHAGWHTEQQAPYALGGDTSGKPKALKFTAGKHTIVASTLAGGAITSSINTTLTVIDNTAATPAAPTTPNPNAGTPVATVKAISSVVPAGTSVHVDALASQLKGGHWNEGTYVWDFGDAGSAGNVMHGFNAAHTYDTPGTYAVTLTVTNAAGNSDAAAMNVTVAAANRKIVYVSNDGSDANDGLSTSSAIKTVAKAMTLLDDNTEIRFQRGDTFAITSTFYIGRSNVVIGAYGSGAKPTIKWTGVRENDEIFYPQAGSKNVTVQDLSIDTIYDADTDDHGVPTAFRPGGTNFTARRCELLNVQNGFLMNLNPTGVMIQDNAAPLETGLRKYFAWVQGSHVTIVGNAVANSTREHVVRANFASMLNVSGNDFHNISRRTQGDYWDYRKTALNIQSGEFAYAYDNKLDGSLQVGPLGKTEGNKGMMTAAMRFKYAVAEGNEVFDDQIVVNHGAEHVTLKDNVDHYDDGLAITVDGYDANYKRGVVDLTIDHNTVVNGGAHGGFIHVYGAVDGIRLTDNLYVAPNLTIGEQETAAVKLEPAAYASFTEIDGNVWPAAAKVSNWVGENAMNYVGTSYTTAGMLTAEEWNGLANVGDDTFRNVTPTQSFGLTIGGRRVGATLAA